MPKPDTTRKITTGKQLLYLEHRQLREIVKLQRELAMPHIDRAEKETGVGRTRQEQELGIPITTRPSTEYTKVGSLKINFTGAWVPHFKKDGAFDGWKWVAEKRKKVTSA